MTCVVGLISPILFGPPLSVNHMLPFGPATIATGALLVVGVAKSLMACVAGLISPIFPTISRFGEPHVAVRAEARFRAVRFRPSEA